MIDGRTVEPRYLSRVLDSTTADLERLGVGPGSAVTTAVRTGLPVVATVLAAERLGAVAVLGPPPSTTKGIASAGSVLRAVKARIHGQTDGAPLIEAVAGTQDARLPSDGGAVFWTSGGTGTPKAVLLSRNALDYQATASWERFQAGRDDRWLVPIPLTHAYGYSILRMWLTFGPTLHLLPALHPSTVAAQLAAMKTTLLDGVPSMYAILLRLAERDANLRAGLASLRLRGCGGDVLPDKLARRFADVVGHPIHDGYGLTEAGPNVAVSGPGACRIGTVGPPLNGTKLSVDDETCEVLVSGPGLMAGYLGDTPATAAPLTEDGWLRTGDRGEILSDGYLKITGRIKDIIIVQGETFAPSTIEDALKDIPGVGDAAVVGVSRGDARGDLLVAFISPQHEKVTEGLVTRTEAACREVLPPGLRPRRIELIPRLPRLGPGKTDRAALRRRAAGHHG